MDFETFFFALAFRFFLGGAGVFKTIFLWLLKAPVWPPKRFSYYIYIYVCVCGLCIYIYIKRGL